jgi:dihydroorotase
VDSFQVPAFFDAHLHLRQGPALRTTVPLAARVCDRVLVMPNTNPPITNAHLALAYRREIMAACPDEFVDSFCPLMTLYLTPQTTAAEIEAAASHKYVAGVKVYPAHGTTNSQSGIPADWLVRAALPFRAAFAFRDVLKAVVDSGLVLNVHAEDPSRELIERESAVVQSGFFEWYGRLGGRVVMEHASTDDAVGMVYMARQKHDRVAATVTLHHLSLTIDDVVGRPHNFCRPVARYRRDRDELRAAVREARPGVFFGSDSAPHEVGSKECASACAGCFTAPGMAAALAQEFVFGDLTSQFANPAEAMAEFTSRRAGEFYRVPASGRKVTLVREPWAVPARVGPYIGPYVPWLAGRALDWQVEGDPLCSTV